MNRLLFMLILFGIALAHPFNDGGLVQGDVKFEPNDQPKVGVSTVAWVQFISIAGQPVNPQDCFCTLLFYQGQVSATTKPDTSVRLALNPATGRMEGRVVFPKSGPYFLVLLGRPMPGKTVPPFIMNAIFFVN
ncbi:MULTISPECIES: hypothetical protein [Thermaceae]|uniref:Uncharacterized protein n=2 Tax=Thermaceae TaxID=188786 RepID=A0A399FER1_9DEIN|nr:MULTISPECIES: hypothetical protein [Thermaceae]MBI5813069.1 hypothetical protein [Allomeiothermus silvanus]MCL6526412.1 hypothetical protein [Thermaceae bacterium]RIH93491.1 hypothetical protein Mgrana_00545 [Meiothermus granaticius NBRC 107808]RTI03890.1 hypothetical protein CSW30_14245 [Thermus scotoductus]GEM85986.1 hypothetical protein MGR01S_06110 [Meiothermus granaticius NBRC 107808]